MQAVRSGVLAQSPKDSLLSVAAAFPTPQSQADSLNEWAWNLREAETQVALQLAREALRISQKANYTEGEAVAFKRMGTIYRIFGAEDQALKAYHSSLAVRHKMGDALAEASVLGNIGNIYLDQKDNALARKYFHRAAEINLANGARAETTQQFNGLGIAHEAEKQLDSAIFYYQKAAASARFYEDSLERDANLARTWNNLGSPFKTIGELDSAMYYWKMSYETFQAMGDFGPSADPLNNLGVLYMDQKDPQRALDSFFHPAMALARAEGNVLQRQDITENISLAHEQLGNFDSALTYRKYYLALHDTLFNKEKSDEIANSETRYQVKEKDATNALLRSEGQRKTIIILAVSIIALLVAGLAALFIYFQRKRLKAQQELSLRKQQEDALRILELVQTQELRSLESLVEGQEQERNRMATELHDGLGSLLATVKLYFNQLDVHATPQQSAFDKADSLLDEACQEVRRYSHDLAGLPIVQFGLLAAVRDLADSISGAGKLQVRVYAHQMDERLPLPLERALYKVIQELLTNVIKHAHATEVTLQLSRHDDHLNLMLEDNGKGLDTRLQAQQTGLGLRSIQARIEAFGGEFVLDSKQGHGTTALIDIPLKEVHYD
jgi:signal transduction histidine kinase